MSKVAKAFVLVIEENRPKGLGKRYAAGDSYITDDIMEAMIFRIEDAAKAQAENMIKASMEYGLALKFIYKVKEIDIGDLI